jgi:hypothetical protein
MAESISGYDIIGDIHGHAQELKMMLQKLGYALRDGVWTHSERKAIFVGDYVDRGPEIREALNLVKTMVDAGSANAIMGNHEFNALAFAYHNPTAGHIRKHSIKNILQHHETIRQFQGFDREWEDYLAWFANLPLFLEMDGLRVVHACWDDDHVTYLKKLNGPITKELLLKAHNKNDRAYTVFDEVLKGKEIKLPDGHYFIDKEGNRRVECRIKWWMNTEGLSLGECLFHPPATVRNIKLPLEFQADGYDAHDPPVFFGHYWLDAKKALWQATNVCCLDYSVARKGMLVAYQHYHGQENTDNNFVTIHAI